MRVALFSFHVHQNKLQCGLSLRATSRDDVRGLERWNRCLSKTLGTAWRYRPYSPLLRAPLKPLAGQCKVALLDKNDGSHQQGSSAHDSQEGREVQANKGASPSVVRSHFKNSSVKVCFCFILYILSLLVAMNSLKLGCVPVF